VTDPAASAPTSRSPANECRRPGGPRGRLGTTAVTPDGYCGRGGEGSSEVAADRAGQGGDAGQGASGGAGSGDCAPTPDRESFSASMRVLLADGKTAAISSLKPGDKVEASDTKTGKDQAETVTAVLLHHDTDLYNVGEECSSSAEIKALRSS
jgi:hypothetical protein